MKKKALKFEGLRDYQFVHMYTLCSVTNPINLFRKSVLYDWACLWFPALIANINAGKNYLQTNQIDKTAFSDCFLEHGWFFPHHCGSNNLQFQGKKNLVLYKGWYYSIAVC